MADPLVAKNAKRRWIYKYNAFKQFIIDNKRKPSQFSSDKKK